MLATTKARRARPGKYTEPRPKKYVLTDAALGTLRDQIVIVLADYQSCRTTECYSCHADFPDGIAKCPKCGADHRGFSRNSGITMEVADRILSNLKIIAEKR